MYCVKNRGEIAMEFFIGAIGLVGSGMTIYEFVNSKLKNDSKAFKSQIRKYISSICDTAIEAFEESPELQNIIPSFANDIIYEEVMAALESGQQVDMSQLKLKLEIGRDDIFNGFIRAVFMKLNESFEYSQRDYNAWSRQKSNDIANSVGGIKDEISQIKKSLENHFTLEEDIYSISGVVKANDFWSEYTNSTQPTIAPECLLIGRTNQVDELSKWLNSPTGNMIVKSESALEARLFAIATAINIGDGELLERIIVVEKFDCWERVISKASNQSIIIPTFPLIDDMNCPQDCHVLFLVSKFDQVGRFAKDNSGISLSKYNSEHFDKLLKILGYETDKHASIIFNTKRCFHTLYRKLTTNPLRQIPKWTKKENAKELLAAMFVGGWSSSCTGDVKTIEKLSGMDYDKYTSLLVEWANMEDAPIVIVDSNYYTIDVHEMWDFMYSKITQRDMDNLKNCLIDVLSEENPKFELPKEQWAFANIYGKTHDYSQQLTRGIIITMIMVSERDGQDSSFGIINTKSWVDSIVKQILDSTTTWQKWNTIAPSLQLLAEVSPIVLIERIEEAVRVNDKGFWKMFTPAKDMFTDSNYYTHVLWALETLVWFNESAVRAIRLLASIGEHDIEYKMTNSPINSLHEIFCLWHPQSCLNTDARMELLEIIAEAYPQMGWVLIEKLIPSNHATCMSISRPRWKEYRNDFSEGILTTEYNLSAKKVFELSLEYSNNVKERWISIIKKIARYDWIFKDLEEKFKSACNHLNESEKIEILDELRGEISRHREFSNSDWSVPETIAAKWEQLLNQMMPDTINSYQYLLNFNPPVLNPVPYKKDVQTDFAQRDVELLQLRMKAYDDIVCRYGQETFLQLCSKIKDTGHWAQIISENLLNYQYELNMLRKIKDINFNLYSNILWVLNSHNGFDALVKIFTNDKTLTNIEVGEMVCCTPLSMDVWLELEDMDIARLEIAYMPMFRHGGEPEALIRCLTERSELFIECVSKAYKSDTEDTVISVDEQTVLLCHDVLQKFKNIPGCNSNLIDETVFNNWIKSAEQLANNLGYKRGFEICIGKLLSYSPVGSDGIYPHEIVRNYLENNYSRIMLDVFVCEKINQRGVYYGSKGKQEKIIAQKFKDDASLLRITSPVVASILDDLSERYFRDYRYEQIREHSDYYL